MRTRTRFATLLVGAALLAGGPVAVAQAAPAPAQADTASTVAAHEAKSGAALPRTYTDVGTYRTKAACEADGNSSIYSDWYCKRSSTTSNYHLWVNLDS